ncbi:3392_t:CDS:2, partial [Entrophospora sp. SA101]
MFQLKITNTWIFPFSSNSEFQINTRCIRVEKIIDYLCEPLRKCLKDDDPYVRKTAAICVAKLYDLNSELAIENGFVAMLQDMVSDSNPMVVANAITAL